MTADLEMVAVKGLVVAQGEEVSVVAPGGAIDDNIETTTINGMELSIRDLVDKKDDIGNDNSSNNQGLDEFQLQQQLK